MMADEKKKFEISGPGAADFLTSQGGLDRPETDSSKGMTQTRDEGTVVNEVDTLVPNLDAPDPTVTRERGVTPPGRDERRNE
jgi:hypothetical protein